MSPVAGETGSELAEQRGEFKILNHAEKRPQKVSFLQKDFLL